ncbi:signal peptidase I [Bacillus sp. RO2]|uniref:signal peptidase I n=1 Tax=Bacillus sp. RO2 TaxID=2723913 RepID=UPI00145EFF3F|nr:signal peptidase I [Bacillus sp. RO2]NMH74390.1 signal peptidase I [Bacillus sp. RO2]
MIEKELKELRKEMNQYIFNDVSFKEDSKEGVILKIGRKPQKKRSRNLIYSVSTLAIAVLFFMVFPLLFSDQKNTGVITDNITNETIDRVNYEKDMLLYEHGSDNMDRYDYNYYKEPIVIDPDYYNDKEFRRGDVVYFQYPENGLYQLDMKNSYGEPKSISRVVGLPGEIIHINDGQIYINNKKLDTFYGNAVNNPRNDAIKDSLNEHELEKYRIPENHVFVIGDSWWRSVDSITFGSLSVENIEGKVLGYRK